jgi:SAM-dependent methyltransferase
MDEGELTEPSDEDIHGYYQLGHERDRLFRDELEFERTKEILLRHLPPTGATVADIGGGPGAYSIWLAQLGYKVIHRDLVPLHVEQMLEAAQDAGVQVDAAVGDARSLDIGDSSVDAVLLLGPLYHLPKPDERVQVWREAGRAVRPGGHVFAVGISRWAALLDGVVVKKMSRKDPRTWELWNHLEKTGVMMQAGDSAFSGFCHLPKELVDEARQVGLEVVDLVAVEGIGFALHDISERWADPQLRYDLLEAARRIERVPELIGLGPHLMLTARRSA